MVPDEIRALAYQRMPITALLAIHSDEFDQLRVLGLSAADLAAYFSRLLDRNVTGSNIRNFICNREKIVAAMQRRANQGARYAEMAEGIRSSVKAIRNSAAAAAFDHVSKMTPPTLPARNGKAEINQDLSSMTAKVTAGLPGSLPADVRNGVFKPPSYVPPPQEEARQVIGWEELDAIAANAEREYRETDSVEARAAKLKRKQQEVEVKLTGKES